jgi:hypothetical protein
MENDPETKKADQEKITNILKSMMEQNYFQFKQQCYKQTTGLAMGTSISAILAEVYIPYIEHKKLYPVLKKHQIIAYFRYVNNILIIYNQNKTNIEEPLTEFNKQTASIKFTIKIGQKNSINFLDLAIHLKRTKLEFRIYRKPTQTDTIIPNDSCHPHEHKVASINYLINRVHTYPITKGLNIIQDTLCNNEYNNKNLNISHSRNHKHNKITSQQNVLHSRIVEKK